MFIDDVHYHDVLVLYQSENPEKVKELGLECLCCTSIICPNNWYPNKTLSDLVNQYLNYKNIFEND